jgi:hypothetical protein
MNRKTAIILCLFLFFSLAIIGLNYDSVTKNETIHKYSFKNSHSPCEAPSVMQELSKRLNNAQREIGLLSFDKSLRETLCNGKVCRIDEKLAEVLSKLLSGKTVASFGDGPGEYKRIISNLNQVKSYNAFDDAPHTEKTTNNEVLYLDLSVPVYHLPLYDWVVSLEVADHFEKKSEQIFIDNLTRHAKEGIILSWSRVRESRVNNQESPYVEEQFLIRNFKINIKMTKKIKKAAAFIKLKKY